MPFVETVLVIDAVLLFFSVASYLTNNVSFSADELIALPTEVPSFTVTRM